MSDLAHQLRQCAATHPDLSNPFWVDQAKRLMRWAADALDAADVALWEHYRKSRHCTVAENDSEQVQNSPAGE